MKPCVYRREDTNKTVGKYDSPVYECLQLQECTEDPISPNIATCKDCYLQLAPTDENFSSKWQDPLHVFDRRRELTHSLRGLLARGKAFLVCGGPSATEDKIEALSNRGHFSLAVNNKAGHTAYRPQAFVYSDDSFKFSHSIWYDPAIMKFCPTPKWNGYRANLKIRDPLTHKFSPGGKVLDCPNVWAFSRRSWMVPDESFFIDPAAAWGNHQSGVERTGREKTVSTMLLALRILYYLGAREIYLVGVDFTMIPGKEYSFAQGKESPGASDSNNAQYYTVNSWLTEMQDNGVFSKFGLRVYNTNPESSLTAFPYLDFGEALYKSRGYVEQIPDLRHWYEKIDEDFMERIENLVLEGLTANQIVEKVNQGIDNQKKQVSIDKVSTYLRVLMERNK